MDGGLESRCVGRVYGADGAVCRTAPSAPYTRIKIYLVSSSWHFKLFHEEDARYQTTTQVYSLVIFQSILWK